MHNDISTRTEIRNAMTVDVEDYFQVSAFDSVIKRDEWDQYPCRVERNVDRVLELFDAAQAKGTFFFLGWIAERYPDLVRRIVEAGHELASHGYAHVRSTGQTPQEFKRDVEVSKRLLEDLSGLEVNGFRAASFSVNSSNLWALDILGEVGYRYSSSVYPFKSDLYGMPEAPRFPFRIRDGAVLEIPITTLPVMKNRNLPCGGGGYFRLMPYLVSRWALRSVNNKEGQPAVFYFHPWELDPGQPRQEGITLTTRIRHYTNLHRTENRLYRLLRDFRWGRVDEVFTDAWEPFGAPALGEHQVS